MLNTASLQDTIRIAMARAREEACDMGMTGHGVLTLWNPKDGIKEQRGFTNLITTMGDEYYAKRAIQGINSYSYSTVVNGMKLGTGTTAAAKSGAGSFIVTYSSASGFNRSTWDSSFPTATAVGTDTGWYAKYQITWAAGTATNSALTEATLVTDATTDDAGSAAETVSRVVFTAINKTAADALTITWNHKLFGQAA